MMALVYIGGLYTDKFYVEMELKLRVIKVNLQAASESQLAIQHSKQI